MISPSVNMWTSTHVEAGTQRWTTPRITRAIIHNWTGRVARRCHDPLRRDPACGSAVLMGPQSKFSLIPAQPETASSPELRSALRPRLESTNSTNLSDAAAFASEDGPSSPPGTRART